MKPAQKIASAITTTPPVAEDEPMTSTMSQRGAGFEPHLPNVPEKTVYHKDGLT